MLSCPEARAHISDYIDGDLDPATAHAVDEHLGSCTTCPPLAKALIGLLAELRHLPEHPPAEAWLADLVTTALSGPVPEHPTTNQGETQ
ncbi:MAG: hypothetical protein NVS3B12_04800 [Acidimicrobiales bacterium]